jgi:hypothetical protein
MKGEVVSLSFKSNSTYPFFVKRSLGGQRHELKRWISAEEGLISARVKVFIFEKSDLQIFRSQQPANGGMEMVDENPDKKFTSLTNYRQNLGISRRFRAGSQFTLLLGAQKKGITVLDVVKEVGNGEWTLDIETRGITMEKFNKSNELGRFAMMEGREFIGYGEVIEIRLA